MRYAHGMFRSHVGYFRFILHAIPIIYSLSFVRRSNPNILRYHSSWIDKTPTSESLHIQLESFSCTLWDQLSKGVHRHNVSIKWGWSLQIMSAVAHVHAQVKNPPQRAIIIIFPINDRFFHTHKGLVHRQLSPWCFFVTPNGRCKLG
jgi:hypothetical protein